PAGAGMPRAVRGVQRGAMTSTHAMLVTVAGLVSYHLIQRSLRPGINPFALLTMTYAIAFLAALVCWVRQAAPPRLQALSGPGVGLGLAVFAVEVGFLYGYRSGWSVSSASVMASSAVAAVLLPVGHWAFAEPISGRAITGLTLCLVGLALMRG